MKKKYYILPALLAFFFASCDLDINVNPDEPMGTTADQLLPVVLFYGAQTNYDHAEYGVYLSQALTTGGRSQTGSLAYKSGWEFLLMNRHPQWRRHYYDIGVNAREMIKEANKIGSRNYELIGRTVVLMSTLYTTDAFGDMPLSDAYVGLAPKYDTQAQIYDWMYKEVDELLALYNNPAVVDSKDNQTITFKQDRIFGGDLEKWKSFTYALKAKIYLRKLPNMDTSAATCNTIIDAVDAAIASWAEPQYKYDGGVSEQNCPWGPQQPTINSWESRKNELDKAILSEYFAVNILGTGSGGFFLAADPRLDKIMKRRAGPTGDTSLKVRYLKNNIGMEASYVEANFPDLYGIETANASPVFTTNTSYISYMLTEELLFIKAEAQYWLGNKEAAQATAVEAATTNMHRHGVAQARINTYLNNANYLPQAGFNIGHLMRQKYICLYLQADQWTDMRRYRYSNNINDIKYDGVVVYPGLRRPYNLYEAYWSGNEDWVQRLNYDPETEEKYNKAELERLGAYRNPSWLKVPMIWAKVN